MFSRPPSSGDAIIRSGDATGNRLPPARNFSGNIAVDFYHERPRRALDFNVTANYNGDCFVEADSFLRQEPYTIMNTSLKWTLSGAQLSVTAFARHLLDEQVIMPATTQSTGCPAADSNTPGAFGAAVQVRF